MLATAPTPFPLIDLRAVSNSAHQWVALSARLSDPAMETGAGAEAADAADVAKAAEAAEAADAAHAAADVTAAAADAADAAVGDVSAAAKAATTITANAAAGRSTPIASVQACDVQPAPVRGAGAPCSGGPGMAAPGPAGQAGPMATMATVAGRVAAMAGHRADIDADQHPDTVLADPWLSAFDSADLLAAIAPLDCVIHLADPAYASAALLARLPASRVVLAIDADALGQPNALRKLGALQGAGYRILIDGGARAGTTPPPPTLRAFAHDAADALAPALPLLALFGPHLAHGVDSPQQFDTCSRAGFTWFSGRHAARGGAQSPLPAIGSAAAPADDGTTGRRLLKLLGLLLADAETRDIELQLKQDPALCYHLLRLVNSAAFAAATPIHDFAQAIDRLGRRQLLRWLQLLLYARPRDDGLVNPLLPLAALRAAQIESLCKQHGCDRDAQDLAFQVGVFSLLDVLLCMPMADIVAALFLQGAAADALLERRGGMGALLALVEARAPAAPMLAAAGVTPQQWWLSQLHGYHWAIQVSRNL